MEGGSYFISLLIVVDCLSYSQYSSSTRLSIVIRWPPPDTSPSALVFRSNAWTVSFFLCMRSIVSGCRSPDSLHTWNHTHYLASYFLVSTNTITFNNR